MRTSWGTICARFCARKCSRADLMRSTPSQTYIHFYKFHKDILNDNLLIICTNKAVKSHQSDITPKISFKLIEQSFLPHNTQLQPNTHCYKVYQEIAT